MEDALTDDVARFEKLLLSHAHLDRCQGLRRFAFGCVEAAAGGSAVSLLSCEAVELIGQRAAAKINEGTFRHRAAAVECRFPMLALIAGLRKFDPRAASTLTILAALRPSPVEAALDAARGERLHAELAARRFAVSLDAAGSTSARSHGPALDADRAVRRCLGLQALRLHKACPR
jgi:hypothetical protein